MVAGQVSSIGRMRGIDGKLTSSTACNGLRCCSVFPAAGRGASQTRFSENPPIGEVHPLIDNGTGQGLNWARTSPPLFASLWTLT